MVGGVLFRRFLLRFLTGLMVALLLFAPLMHLFQMRVVHAEWGTDLNQEAAWAARHTRPGIEVRFSQAWRQMHSSVRVTFFDREGKLVADSHPERVLPDLAALREGTEPSGYLAAIEELGHGGWLVMSRPWVPAFPYGLHWELVAAAVFVVAIAHMLLYPLVRSISTTLGQLAELAREVAAGHFGKTLEVHRNDELGVLVRAFNHMSQQLAEAEQLNTRLLHDVSHELRSPLGRIQVMAETSVLRPGEAAECVKGIGQEIALLDRLVGDLLEAARIESDADAVRVESFALLDWARGLTRRLERRVRAAGVGWKAVLPAEDRQVRGDPQRLAQALGNLVDNAVHALDGRDDAAIEVRITADSGLRITVADNGPGIPAGDLPHVFRRFYRVGTDRGRQRGGVGLGLSVVQAIVTAHGGEVDIHCPPEGGTRVLVSIPG